TGSAVARWRSVLPFPPQAAEQAALGVDRVAARAAVLPEVNGFDAQRFRAAPPASDPCTSGHANIVSRPGPEHRSRDGPVAKPAFGDNVAFLTISVLCRSVPSQAACQRRSGQYTAGGECCETQRLRERHRITLRRLHDLDHAR